MNDATKSLKWTSFGLEAFLAIPILGGSVILGLYWMPLFIMLIVHIVTLIFSLQDKTSYYGSVVGIVASVLGWIPFVGWALHVAAAITLLLSAIERNKFNE